MDSLYGKDWYVYCKRPFKTTHSVLAYLGRYTHRVAISNHRIVSVADGKISFKWRDYRDGSAEKVMTLPAREFIRRFLLHVLPLGFTKIRHYGFLASAIKWKSLALCRRELAARPPERRKLNTAQLMLHLTGRDINCCPCCGARYPGRAPPENAT